MTHAPTTPPPSGSPQPPEQPRNRRCSCLLPGKDNLHPYARLAFAALANIFLALCILPKAGHATDPEYAISNLIWPGLMLVIPACTLFTLLPLFLFGRDVPRLLSIGLSFLPCYLAVVGFSHVLSLCCGSR